LILLTSMPGACVGIIFVTILSRICNTVGVAEIRCGEKLCYLITFGNMLYLMHTGVNWFMANNKTIFLVDDDEEDRMLLSAAINETISGVDLVEVSNGIDLLKLLEENVSHPSQPIILMDMNMPQMNGLETLVRIKQNTALRHIPIVMISTTSNPRHILSSYDLGISAYITKPVTSEEFTNFAEAVSVCFFNEYPSERILLNGKDFKTKSYVIIEDNDDHLELINLALRQNMPNLKTFRLRDKCSAMAFFESQFRDIVPSPDLILLDLYLPARTDGLALLEMIKDYFVRYNLPPVPVIITSSSSNLDDVSESYKRQANAYIIKPTDPDNWLLYFASLSRLWSKTIMLPKKV
jgi:CheY-like chemotaxis protein